MEIDNNRYLDSKIGFMVWVMCISLWRRNPNMSFTNYEKLRQKVSRETVRQAIFLLFSLIVVFLITRCKNPTSTQPQVKSLASLNLDNAKAVYIGVHENAQDASGQTRAIAVNLFKITTDNSLEIVQYLSYEDKPLFTEMEPVALYNTNGEYFVLGLGNISGGSFDVGDGYLVRKSDGNVAQLGYGSQLVFPDRQTYFANAGTLQMDDAKNVYFIDYFTGVDLFKLSLAGETYNLEQVNPNRNPLGWYMVDGSGNVALANNSDVSYLSRLLTVGKGAVELGSLNFWVAADNHLYVDEYNSDDKNHDLIKINPTATDSVSFDTVATDLEQGILLSPGMNFLLNSGQRTVIAQQQTDTSAVLWEVYNSGGVLRIIPTPGVEFTQINTAVSTEQAFYFAGKTTSDAPTLIRLDANSDAVTTVTQDYNITLMEKSGQGDIYFSGYRTSDNAKVLGILSSSGTITILDDTLATPVIGILDLT